jgi:hypothetical protein
MGRAAKLRSNESLTASDPSRGYRDTLSAFAPLRAPCLPSERLKANGIILPLSKAALCLT